MDLATIYICGAVVAFVLTAAAASRGAIIELPLRNSSEFMLVGCSCLGAAFLWPLLLLEAVILLLFRKRLKLGQIVS